MAPVHIAIALYFTTNIKHWWWYFDSPDLFFSDVKHHCTIVQCLRNVGKEDITDVGMALGLHYSSLKEMQRFPHDMVLAWLQQKDSVAETTGNPTAGVLIQALMDSQLKGIADIVKSKFNSA